MFPCSLPEGRVRVRVDRWVGWRGGICDLPTPLVVLCAGIVHSTLLLFPAPQKWQLGFASFVCYCSYFAPTAMGAVIFSPL